MTTEALLSRLSRVRKSDAGPGRWTALCPAHDDRSRSLSVRELDDGRTLIHCFALCSVEDVLAAVGLNFDALFPPRATDHHVRRQRDPFDARTVLMALADETMIAAIVCARVAYGHAVDWPELDRLMTAVGRIAAAADLFKPHPSEGRRAALSRAEIEELAHA